MRGVVVCWSTSSHTDSPLVRMNEEVDYKRCLSVMVACYLWGVDSVDFDLTLVPDKIHYCMDRALNYCWFKAFLSARLEELPFMVRLRQMHSDTFARVLLG